MPQLNHEQEQAASFLYGICSVVSIPGSGKTWTMMERIVKMVRDHEIPPESILGITFTRNAAEVMRTRLSGLLGEAAERVMLSTTHAFCHYLLRTEGVLFDLLTGKEQLSFIKDVLKKTRLKELAPVWSCGR